MAELKFCPKCGKERLDSSVKVCEGCGFEFEKKDTSKGFIIAIIVIALILPSLSIMGVVAALTIPTLVNRQNQLAAQVKIKKSIASYEAITAAYMAEYEKKSFANVLTPNCDNAQKYLKFISQDNCNFEMIDGSYWEFDPSTGYAAVTDKKDYPIYGVVLWAMEGTVNSTENHPSVSELKFPSNNPKCILFAQNFLKASPQKLRECTYKR